MRALPTFSVIALLALSAAHPRADEKPALRSTQTDHYLFQSDCPQAAHDEFARVIEAGWAPMKEFFGSEPALKKDEHLKVYFFEKEADWEAQIKRDGTNAPQGAGGYYWPPTKTAYLWRQPTLYNSRQLLIHEVMHQFHFLSKCNNVAPKDAWYTEGLAEHVSRHFWDGKKVTLGVLPLLTLENYSEKALQLFEDKKFDFAGLIDSTRTSARPEQWALVRFLITADKGAWKDKWQTLIKRLDQGELSKNCFRSIVGDPAKISSAILAWLKTEQEAFKPDFYEWEGTAPGVYKGWSTVTTTCHARADASELHATLEVPEGAYIGGLLLQFTNGEDYTCAYIKSSGAISVNRRINGGWKILFAGPAPKPEDPKCFRLSCTRAADGVTFAVEGQNFGPFDLPGNKLGLCLDNCTLSFRDVIVK